MKSFIKNVTAAVAAFTLIFGAFAIAGVSPTSGGQAEAHASKQFNTNRRVVRSGNTAVASTACHTYNANTNYTFDFTSEFGSQVAIVEVNVTVVNPTGTGFASFGPGTAAPGNISQLSWTGNQGRQVNAFSVILDSSDRMALKTSRKQQFCIDILNRTVED